jgi:hypothetical protein
MNDREIMKAVKKVLKTGFWMVRTDDNDISYNSFR